MSRLPLPERTRTGPAVSPFARLLRPPAALAAPVAPRRVDLVWTDEVSGERLEIEVVADPGLIERLRHEGFEELPGGACSGASASAGAPGPDDGTAAA